MLLLVQNNSLDDTLGVDNVEDRPHDDNGQGVRAAHCHLVVLSVVVVVAIAIIMSNPEKF